VTTLTEFLEARITEDEADAEGPCGCKITTDATGPWLPGGIHGWSCPIRVLAECAAKRWVLSEHCSDKRWPLDRSRVGCRTCQLRGDIPLDDEWPCLTLRILALPYADHPQFQPGWRV